MNVGSSDARSHADAAGQPHHHRALADTRGLATNALDGHGQVPQAPAELVRAASETPSVFCPGTSASYSNTGYLLLGLIVEAAEQQSFQAVLQRRIAEPLGLRHLRAFAPNEEQPSDLATPHLEKVPQTDPGTWSRVGLMRLMPACFSALRTVAEQTLRSQRRLNSRGSSSSDERGNSCAMLLSTAP